ncbi:MoaD/ThiS family protein [Gudongella sp. DL1XJH-153]|uniref:MoaD/ThiS family protein n=1 Tax=Gudongella sp. DL1XJH-153 TaxID=3409804 RepID=UPI003BB5F580
MIKIEVRYFATLRIDDKKKETLEVQEDTSVETLLDQIGVNLEDVAILLVNGIRTPPENKLKDGDILSLFPPVGGG